MKPLGAKAQGRSGSRATRPDERQPARRRGRTPVQPAGPGSVGKPPRAGFAKPGRPPGVAPARSAGPPGDAPASRHPVPDSHRAAAPAPARQPAAAPASHPATVTHLTVGEDGDGQRLDNHLVRILKGVPRTWIWRVIRTGEVRINGHRADARSRIATGDVIRIPPVSRPPPKDAAAGLAQRPLDDLTILHEDDAWLVLNKPAGLAVHGGSGVAAGLIERLRASRPDDRFLELAHRIDRETSGLLIVARSRAALLSLHRQFAAGTPRKHYRALVGGRWGRPGTTPLRFPLERLEAPNGDRRVRVAAGGAPAETRVRLIGHHPGEPARGQPAWFSMLDCELLTGRTHQIRVHLAHAGVPIIGDPKYGDFNLNRILQKQGFNRMFLHAFSIELDHPIDGRRCRFEAPLPMAFDEALAGTGSAEATASAARPEPR